MGLDEALKKVQNIPVPFVPASISYFFPRRIHMNLNYTGSQGRDPTTIEYKIIQYGWRNGMDLNHIKIGQVKASQKPGQDWMNEHIFCVLNNSHGNHVLATL